MKLSQSNKHLYILLFSAGFFLMLSCSRTKDRAINRYYHQLTSKYNPLYNGQKAYNESLYSLKEEHIDLFDRVLSVVPYDIAKEGGRSYSGFKKAIEKATKTIQEHSMMFRGTQKNPIIFDAYLLMGDAQSAMGLDVAAQESYSVVIRNASKSDRAYKAELNRIKILARQKNSGAVIDALEEMQRTGVPEKFSFDINLLRGQAAAIDGNTLLAAKLFAKSAAETKNREIKSRLAFIAGQLYESAGERARARSSFQVCIAGQPSTYDILLEAYLRRTLNGSSKSISLYKELKTLLKEPKNVKYEDRIYYALSLVAKNLKDKDQQLYFLSRCIGAPAVERPILKAIAHSERGQIYFNDKKYSQAQIDLDSAFLLLPNRHQLKKVIETKRKGLNSLVSELIKIERNDSLLMLSGKSDAVLRSYFNNYIEDLKEQEIVAIKNSKRNALNAKLQATTSLLSMGAPTAGGAMAGGWIFYNPVSRSSGIATFSEKWGQRPNVDNWRLQSASGNWSIVIENGPIESNEQGELKPYVDPSYDVESYLSAIPRSQEKKDSCKDIICDALVSSAAIYRDQISDYEMALAQINRIISDCPDDTLCVSCEREPFALYALYRLRLLRGEVEMAKGPKSEILKRFPESRYAKTILGINQADTAVEKTSKDFIQLTEHFNKKEWRALIKLSKKTTWSRIEAPRAGLLWAHAIGGQEGIQPYLQALTAVEKGFPNSAQAVAAGNIKMALESMNDKTEKEESVSPYARAPNSPHQLIIILSKAGNPNDVRNALARFHQKYFAGNAMSIRPLPLGDASQIIMIDSFKNSSEINGYRTKIMRAAGVTQFLKPYSAEYWPITVQNFSHFYTNKDIEGYRSFVEKEYGLK